MAGDLERRLYHWAWWLFAAASLWLWVHMTRYQPIREDLMWDRLRQEPCVMYLGACTPAGPPLGRPAASQH